MQAIIRLALADAAALQVVGDPFPPFAGGQTGEGPGVRHDALLQVRLRQRPAVPPGRRDNDGNGQAVFPGKVEVARVVGRHTLNGARAIGQQHVVRDEDGDPIPIHRINRERPDGDSVALLLGGQPLDIRLTRGLELVGLHLGAALRSRQPVHQRVLRGQDGKGHAVDGVRPRREDTERDPRMVLHRQLELDADTPPNPVCLERSDAFRPLDAGKIQQLVGVRRDLQEPLLQILLDHGRAAALTDAFVADNLLTRQRGVILRTPVHRRQRAVRQAALVHLQEEPLVPDVVLRIAGDDLARPFPHRTHGPQLAAHAGDVLHRPLIRVDAVLNRGILRRQPECIKANGKQDVVAPHAPQARSGVGGGHGVPVADVQIAGRIRVHRQEVVLPPRVEVPGLVQAVLLPASLPLCLNCHRIITDHQI